jgi:hypothetical protein
MVYFPMEEIKMRMHICVCALLDETCILVYMLYIYVKKVFLEEGRFNEKG